MFLSEDPAESARFSDNRILIENIQKTSQVLVTVVLYVSGIRSKKIHSYLFSKERRAQTIRKYFNSWPSTQPPQFTLYTSPEARWARKCKNHYDYLLSFLEANMDEFEFRFGKTHPLWLFLDFFRMALYELAFNRLSALPEIKDMKIVLPWKNLPLDCRKKNIIEGYRKWYKRGLGDPILAYVGTKRDVPEWVLGKEPVA